MVTRDAFELTIVESLKPHPVPEPRQGLTPADLLTTPAAALEALRATRGYEAVLKRLPRLEELDVWAPTAYFSVCTKTGSARYLDIWDGDHFDGFTDMPRCVSDCRAWFTADGFSVWGSGSTTSGRVNCFFTAPTTAHYICNARLQSYPAAAGAVVECLIDDSSFGPLPFTGTIDQPHPCHLGAGGHHFRIRQLSGGFFFLSLTVWQL